MISLMIHADDEVSDHCINNFIFFSAMPPPSYSTLTTKERNNCLNELGWSGDQILLSPNDSTSSCPHIHSILSVVWFALRTFEMF